MSDRKFDGGDASRIEALEADLDHEAKEHLVTHEWWMNLWDEVAQLREALREAIGWSYGEDVTPERRAEVERLLDD